MHKLGAENVKCNFMWPVGNCKYSSSHQQTENAVITQAGIIASFPGLPRFYLRFAFTIIHGSGRSAKNGEGLSIHHVSGLEVDVGGGADIHTKLESWFLTGREEQFPSR